MSGVDERYIRELAEDRRETYKAFHDEVKKNRAARYLQDMSIKDVPEAYRTTTTLMQLPRVPDILQRMVSICTDDDPVISMPPQDDTETAERNASRVERWLQGAIERMIEDADRDPWRNAMDAALCDGLGVLKLIDDKLAWDDEPARSYEEEDETGAKIKKEKDAKKYLKEVEDYRKGAPFPFVLSDLDCLTYFPVASGRRASEVLEITKRPLIPTAKALNVKPTSMGKDGKLRWKKLRVGEKFSESNLPSGSSNSVECMENWHADRVYYTLDGEIVDERSHNYKRPPYFDFGSYTTSSRDPDKRFRSAVSSVRNLVKALNVFLSMKSNWAYLGAWPFLKEDKDVSGGSSRRSGQDSANQIEPGSILRGLSFIDPPNIGRDLDNIVQMLMAEVDRASLSAVMYGYGGGSTSGYQVASLQAAAQSVLKPVLRNAGNALEQMFSFLLYMVEHVIADKVYVYGRGDGDSKSWLCLEPKHLKGYHLIHAELKPLLPLDEIAQRDSALRMFAGGLWDPEKALSETGEEQPEVIIDRRLAYDYLQQSGMSMKIAEDAARRRGLLPEAQAEPQLAAGSAEGVPDVGGPGLGSSGPIEPMIPGQNMPLRPTPPAMANMPVGIQRAPGGPMQTGPLG